MSVHLHLDAARHRAAARMSWQADLRAVLVLDDQGAVTRTVVMFSDGEEARRWAEAHEVASYRVVQAELAEPRW